ncbi:hypothetical protein V1527DRAFT_486047 [Lipomyces starkeyi]
MSLATIPAFRGKIVSAQILPSSTSITQNTAFWILTFMTLVKSFYLKWFFLSISLCQSVTFPYVDYMLEDHRSYPSNGSADYADEVAKPGEVKWFRVKFNRRSYRIDGVNKAVKSILFLILSSKHIGDIGKVVVPIIRKRWIKTFLIGAGVSAFTMIATGATVFTVASCKASLAAALIGAPIWPATSLACIGSAALTVVSVANAGGLYSYGSSQGWVFESNGASVSNRALNGGLYYAITGHYIQHDWDLRDSIMDQYYEQLHGIDANITNVFKHFSYNATLNESLSNLSSMVLKRQGVTVAVLTERDELYTVFAWLANTIFTTHVINKRNDMLASWMSYNLYGENMQEGSYYEEPLDEEANQDKTDDLDDYFVKENKQYHDKFCLGLSPQTDSVGIDSIIVGEIYVNAYGGLDGECQNG